MAADYYKTSESVAEYIQLAKEVNGGALIEKLKTYLLPGSKLLEIGSGPGTDWYMLSKVYEVVGSDNSSAFLAHLNKTHPAGKFLLLDAITLETSDHFDGLYANKVLHHLKDDELTAAIQRQHAMLKSGGIICHSFWKGEGDEVFKGLFVNYHTAETLRRYFEAHFEILLLEPYAEFEADDSLLLIGKRK